MTQAINDNSIVKCAEHVVFTEIDGECVILNVASGYYFCLDDIGSKIWELIENPKKVSDIVERLREEYTVKHSECITDTLSFLKGLFDDDLITVVEGGHKRA
jgi:hypothetical protein